MIESPTKAPTLEKTTMIILAALIVAMIVLGTINVVGIANATSSSPRPLPGEDAPRRLPVLQGASPPSRYVIGGAVFVDENENAPIWYARRSRAAGTGYVYLDVDTRHGRKELSGSEAESFWAFLAARSTPFPGPGPLDPKPIPDFPPVLPDPPPGFEEETKSRPMTLPWANGPVVAVRRPDNPDNVVIVMDGRRDLNELDWEPSAKGENVFIVAINANLLWTIVENGVERKLEVDDRGRAWTFAKPKGADGRFRLSLRSTPRP